MKKILLSMMCLLTSVSVFAEDSITFINADGSPAGDLCIAAAKNEDNLDHIANDLGISPNDMDQVYCNGKPLDLFILQYREKNSAQSAYVLYLVNNNPDTRLCMAALTSEDEYMYIRNKFFSGVKNIESVVQCNNMPLRQFVRKYQERVILTVKPEEAAKSTIASM